MCGFLAEREDIYEKNWENLLSAEFKFFKIGQMVQKFHFFCSIYKKKSKNDHLVEC